MANEVLVPFKKPIPWSSNLRSLSQRFGNHVAIRDGNDALLTFRGLDEHAHALAYQLKALGVTHGEAIAVLLPNSCEAVWVSYGIRLHGAAETPLSFNSTSEELAWYKAVAKFSCVITFEEKAALVQALNLKLILVNAKGLQAAASSPGDLNTLAASSFTTEVWPPIDPNVAGRIMFTSGTTGKPKGVLYSHGARSSGEQLQKATLPFMPNPGERILLMTPFVHGASLITYAWCDLGGEVVLLNGVDIEGIRPLLDEKKLCAIFAPPTVLAKILFSFEGRRFEGVRCIFTGTQPLTAALYHKACAMFGPVVRITFGKSECVNPITVLDPAATHEYFNSSDQHRPGACVGWPAPGVEIRIADAQVSDDPDERANGEVLLRAPQMSNTLLSPEGLIPHSEGGWHATGDLGYVDDRGRLVLTGRIADVIKTGGYRVNPDEIEAVLSGLPQSGQITVTSLPSDYWGEIIVAVAEHAQAGWVQAASERVAVLSRHKQPRLHIALDALPRNPQGKVSRRQVRAAVLARYHLLDGPYPEIELRA